jgi:hypothetical protein
LFRPGPALAPAVASSNAGLEAPRAVNIMLAWHEEHQDNLRAQIAESAWTPPTDALFRRSLTVKPGV